MNTSLVKEHQGHLYFLCQYIQWKDSWRDPHDVPTNKGFKILKALDNQYIPETINEPGEYFVLKIERRFAVTAHVEATRYSREELQP